MNVAFLVKSCQKYKDRRAACRHTWAHSGLNLIFVVADPAHKYQTAEADVLVVEGISDAYQDIAQKLAAGLRYAVGEGADYVFVCDDDTYVRTALLLKNIPNGQDYVGYLRVEQLESNHDIPYAHGAGYWLSCRAAQIVGNSRLMRPGIIDDGAVGQI